MRRGVIQGAVIAGPPICYIGWKNTGFLDVICCSWGGQLTDSSHQNGVGYDAGQLVTPSRPINHLGSVCFVSFSQVLGFIFGALKSNTPWPHTPRNKALTDKYT